MSEMLGNQYFMARNYPAAAYELENCFRDDPDNKRVQKKLIICLTQTGRILEAFELFHDLIQKDISCIINTDVIKDDCPCPHLISEIKKYENLRMKDFDHYILLGILWLYCDLDQSLSYFNTALQLKSDDRILCSIINYIMHYKEVKTH